MTQIQPDGHRWSHAGLVERLVHVFEAQGVALENADVAYVADLAVRVVRSELREEAVVQLRAVLSSAASTLLAAADALTGATS
jgi:hypothetical protein